MRYTPHLLSAILLLSSATTMAAQTAPSDPTKIPQDFKNISLVYNEENGYWGQQKQANPELLRDLFKMTPTEWQNIQSRNEANGYW